MRIGIFGGSFNPPHKMHFMIASELLEKNYVDKIIYVPTGSKYKYKNNLLPDLCRYEMLKIMTSNDERLSVSDYELKDDVVYTCDTLAYFNKIYPNDDIVFICGADNLSYIDKWKNGYEILEKYKILVIRRDGEDTSELLERFKEYKNNIIITNIVPNKLSSTFIRIYLSNKQYDKICEFMDENVVKYIKENELYVSCE